jgi:hypothetical protein
MEGKSSSAVEDSPAEAIKSGIVRAKRFRFMSRVRLTTDLLHGGAVQIECRLESSEEERECLSE